jgi:hypothetical protein
MFDSLLACRGSVMCSDEVCFPLDIDVAESMVRKLNRTMGKRMWKKGDYAALRCRHSGDVYAHVDHPAHRHMWVLLIMCNDDPDGSTFVRLPEGGDVNFPFVAGNAIVFDAGLIHGSRAPSIRKSFISLDLLKASKTH